tara:strand:- start:217 stop:753 length:537 start_codon:yes stop_codon:yes gene_type:complete
MEIKLIRLNNVDSTNNVAIRRIKKGQIKPTLILAKKQTKGKGQYGRKWISYKGNVFLSIYFCVKKKALLKSITKKIYTVIKKSLNSFVSENITIKLPNDLLINGHKFCGILQETLIYKNNKYFIVGVGINLCKSPKIENKKTSYLQKYSNKKIKINDICAIIKKNFEKFVLVNYVSGR